MNNTEHNTDFNARDTQTILEIRNKPPDYTHVVHGFRPKSEHFDFGKHVPLKEYLKRSRMAQISAS